MTSGAFASHPIDQIYVVREERQRKELTDDDIQSKMESISKIGLINPITIQRDGRLRAGETRWVACKRLGWTSIPVQYIEDLDEATLQLVELDENIKRKNLSWQEECEAVARYHELRTQLDPEWNQVRTAEELGSSAGDVSFKLAIKKEMEKPDSRVHSAAKLSEARNIVSRINQRAAASVLDSIAPKAEKSVPLLNANFHEWAKTYDGPKFNLIHCDFPYGINADNQQQGGNIAVMGGYDDSTGVFFDLLETLKAAMENVVAESAHLIFWYSMRFHSSTELYLREMGWEVNPFPLIWHKSDNAGLLPDPQRGPRRTYETALFASRGDRKIVQAVANSFASPTTKKIHMSEKPLAVLQHFYRMVVDEYSCVLDPTCGSGNSIRAALRSGAASALGLELNPDFYNLAKAHFHDDD